jgi:beta-propeller repeat-containing protein
MVMKQCAVPLLLLGSSLILWSKPSFRDLPVAFEPNEGQAPAEVQFLARTKGYSISFLTNSVSIDGAAAGAFKMQFANAGPRTRLDALDPLPGKSNYLRGRDPRAWHTGIPHFASVCYRSVYRGIDLLFHASPASRLEYDFRVAPGADPASIRLDFTGVRAMQIDSEGNLVLVAEKGEWVQPKPRIFQGNRAVEGGYELLGPRRVGFALGHYDRTKPLVIDPVISYATYFGGDDTTINSIAVDGEGMVYLAGAIDTANLPVTAGAYDSRFNGGLDAFRNRAGIFHFRRRGGRRSGDRNRGGCRRQRLSFGQHYLR